MPMPQVTLRDGYEIRPGKTLSVHPAKFELRGELVQRSTGKDAALQRKRQKVLSAPPCSAMYAPR